MTARHGCWRSTPFQHPWLLIADTACGFDLRMASAKCSGCHRARVESPREQLAMLDELGDVAMTQSEPE